MLPEPREGKPGRSSSPAQISSRGRTDAAFERAIQAQLADGARLQPVSLADPLLPRSLLFRRTRGFTRAAYAASRCARVSAAAAVVGVAAGIDAAAGAAGQTLAADRYADVPMAYHARGAHRAPAQSLAPRRRATKPSRTGALASTADFTLGACHRCGAAGPLVRGGIDANRAPQRPKPRWAHALAIRAPLRARAPNLPRTAATPHLVRKRIATDAARIAIKALAALEFSIDAVLAEPAVAIACTTVPAVRLKIHALAGALDAPTQVAFVAAVAVHALLFRSACVAAGSAVLRIVLEELRLQADTAA